MSKNTWTVSEAKARFSEVLGQVRTGGPQVITKNGRATAILVSPDEWHKKTQRTGNLAEFFATSPLRNADLSISRLKSTPRRTKL